MAVKAQWFVPDLVADGPDPLGEEVDVTEVGVRIDLRDDPDVLFNRLRELLDAESRLFNDGVRCVVKDKADTSCNACPFRGRYGELCSVGVEEEEVITRMTFADMERRGGPER